MEIVQITLAAVTAVATVVMLSALQKANARIRSFGYAVCTAFSALSCISLAPTFEWAGGDVVLAAVLFALTAVLSHGVQLTLAEAKRNMQEPCDICSGYGCPDCRTDQQRG